MNQKEVARVLKDRIASYPHSRLPESVKVTRKTDRDGDEYLNVKYRGRVIAKCYHDTDGSVVMATHRENWKPAVKSITRYET